MKVMLVKPKSSTDTLLPILGLGYLAAETRKKHDTHLLNCIVENKSDYQFGKEVKRLKPDVVGIQTFTLDSVITKHYIKIIREIDPKITIVLGGPHPSALPQSTFDYFEADFAFKGDAEKGFSQFCDLVEQAGGRRGNGTRAMLEDPAELKKIPGLVWKSAKGLTNANPIWIPMELDELPFPAWDLMRPDFYPLSPHAAFMQNFPISPMMVSRGCPFDCTFCASFITKGRQVRYRSVDNVIEEIKLLIGTYGIKEIQFIDDNFTLSRSYVKNFCQRIIDEKLKFSWCCPNGVRLDTLRPDMLELMREAGCYSLSVGIESGSQRVLDFTKRDTPLKMIEEKVDMITNAGIETVGFFILGFPTEKSHEIEQTIDFSLSLNLERANFMNYHPFPGTESWHYLRHAGEMDRVNPYSQSFAEVAYIPKGMTRSKLKSFQRQAFLRFYLRPRYLWGLVKRIKNLEHATFIIKRIWRWMTSK